MERGYALITTRYPVCWRRLIWSLANPKGPDPRSQGGHSINRWPGQYLPYGPGHGSTLSDPRYQTDDLPAGPPDMVSTHVALEIMVTVWTEVISRWSKNTRQPAWPFDERKAEAVCTQKNIRLNYYVCNDHISINHEFFLNGGTILCHLLVYATVFKEEESPDRRHAVNSIERPCRPTSIDGK